MDANKILNLIQRVLQEVEIYRSTHLTGKASLDETSKVLYLLKEQIKKDPERINERVLRAMHDVGMSAYKDFENSALEKAIDAVTSLLYEDLPSYRTLGPLRNDFGKGDPV